MRNFVKQNSIRFGGFYVKKTRQIGYKLCCRKAHHHIGGNSYIGRYSKRQITADNIGRSVVQINTVNL